jgi:hypothetical protein
MGDGFAAKAWLAVNVIQQIVASLKKPKTRE